MLKQNNKNLNKTQQSRIRIKHIEIIIFVKVTYFCVKDSEY